MPDTESVMDRLERLRKTGQRDVEMWVKSKDDLAPGDEVYGVVVEKGTMETDYGISPFAVLDSHPEDPKSPFMRVAGFHGIVEEAINRAVVGDLFYCRFTGRTPSKKQGHDDYYNYRVVVESSSGTLTVSESDDEQPL